MNFREDEALFAKALRAETDRRYNELMQNTIVSGEASEEHHKRIRTMIKLAEKEDKARPNIKKRLIAILIAAVILLVGCATAIYIDEIKEFIITRFDDHVEVDATDKGENTVNKTIDKIYEFTYILEGYKLEETVNTVYIVRNKYVNPSGDEYVISQTVKESDSVNYDFKADDYILLNISDVSIYHNVDSYGCFYVFFIDDYSFRIKSNVSIENALLAKIVEGMK